MIFTFESLPTKPMFSWNQFTADHFSKRIIEGSELTVFTAQDNFDCYLDYLKPTQVKINYSFFEMACFVGFIRIDSGGENCQHYIFNKP